MKKIYAGQRFVRSGSLRGFPSFVPAASPRLWDHHLDFKAAAMLRF